MRDSYAPRKLTERIPEIVKRHPSTAKTASYEPDTSFQEQVRAWAALSEKDAGEVALTIPPGKIMQLADFLGAGHTGVPTEQLIRIVCTRTNERLAKRILSRWSDFFRSSSYNALVKAILEERKETVRQVLKDSPADAETWLQWLNSGDIPAAVGKSAVRYDAKHKSGFQQALQAISVPPESRLGKECIDEYYIFCDRNAYLDLEDQKLNRILMRYSYEQSIRFLKNFLTEMDTQSLRRYYACGKYLSQKYTGLPESDKYNRFFSGWSQEHRTQYNRWMSYILIADSFSQNSNDPRLRFWSKYVPYSVNTYLEKQCEALIMEYEKCCVIEFTSKTMGAVYIYYKGDYRGRIRKSTKMMKNTEFRSFLYNHPYEARFVHDAGGNWQHKVERFLKRHERIS